MKKGRGRSRELKKEQKEEEDRASLDEKKKAFASNPRRRTLIFSSFIFHFSFLIFNF